MSLLHRASSYSLKGIEEVASAGLGALLIGERVSKTVGEGIASLGLPTAFISQFSCALTVQLFAQGGVPVSISQSITGAVSGVGLARGGHALSGEATAKLIVLWTATPMLSLLTAWLLHLAVLG